MALQNSRKGGRFVPASTDSLLSVTFVSLYYSVRLHLQLLLCLSTKGNTLEAGRGCLACGLPLEAAAQHRGLPRRRAFSCKAGVLDCAITSGRRLGHQAGTSGRAWGCLRCCWHSRPPARGHGADSSTPATWLPL